MTAMSGIADVRAPEAALAIPRFEVLTSGDFSHK